MKKLFLLFLFASSAAQAQYLKMEHGFLASNYRNDLGIGFYDEKIRSYALNIGLDYLERKHFYLSSKVGYSEVGGKENDMFLQGVKVKASYPYLLLSTTARAVLRQDIITYFLGAGPYYNVPLGDGAFVERDPTVTLEAKGYLGALGEAGFHADVQRLRLGVHVEYRHGLMGPVSGMVAKFRNHQFGAFASLGFRLK
jgi:hypothetical protein